jgi:diaminopimelate decarboxylase
MWLSSEQATELVAQHNSPVFVYSKSQLQVRVEELLGLSMPFGLTIRYAVKANSHPEIVKLFLDKGLHFDASSSYEASMLLSQGVSGDKISLSSQQSAHNMSELLSAGVQYVATSLHQLELFVTEENHGENVGLRVNPAIDHAGHNNRLSTGGVAASFGLWHEHVDEAIKLAHAHHVTIDRLHTHIGSGADPAIWAKAMETSLNIVRKMPDVTTLDFGGGYKISRVAGEHETDLRKVSAIFTEKLQSFAQETGRKIKLEIEPGTWLVAHAGILLAQVDDIVDTGSEGYTFLRVNTGMNDFIRPAMYGSQHEIEVMNANGEEAEYVVSGHCCETSDILTPMPGDPEHITPRKVRKADIGDVIAIADTGAYCASMSTKQYNAFPSASEAFVE